jgi:tripartite-type tricarboxylate transporter receptor subunit TctC
MVASIGTEASIDSIEGLQKMSGFKFGARGPRGNLAVTAALTAYFLDLKEAKVVTGYGGTSEIILAMKRGEVDGYANSGASTSADIPKGAVKKVVVALAPESAAEFPDVPAIGEIITMTSQQKKMLDILQVFSSSKVFFTAPGVPQDRVDFMRQKFIEILSARGYLRQAKLRWPVWTDPVPGDVLTKNIMALVNLPKSDLAKFEEILKTYMKFR